LSVFTESISPFKVVSAGQARTSDERYGCMVALVHDANHVA